MNVRYNYWKFELEEFNWQLITLSVNSFHLTGLRELVDDVLLESVDWVMYSGDKISPMGRDRR